MRSKKAVGRKGENLAAEYLAKKGFQILGRSLRTSEGEIDLLAQDGEWLVFVEVRTRRSREFGTPEESITPNQKNRLISVAEAYLEGREEPPPWRIDIVAIDMAAPEYRIEHIISAVTREDS